jgi:hypothetical protein
MSNVPGNDEHKASRHDIFHSSHFKVCKWYNSERIHINNLNFMKEKPTLGWQIFFLQIINSERVCMGYIKMISFNFPSCVQMVANSQIVLFSRKYMILKQWHSPESYWHTFLKCHFKWNWSISTTMHIICQIKTAKKRIQDSGLETTSIHMLLCQLGNQN